MGWIIVLLVVAILAVAPYVKERAKQSVDAVDRAQSDQQFVKLSKGTTAYRWHGPAQGPVAVLIHGLTTPSQVWDDLVPHLTYMGYRVVTYDLYGRGLSDAPRGVQSGAFFQTQLTELLDALELDAPVTLFGYSMGGAIATRFAAAQRHRVSAVVLLASGGIQIRETRFQKFTRQVPILGDWLAMTFLERQLARDLDRGLDAHMLEQVRVQQLGRAGYIPAVQSSMRNFLTETQRPEHRILFREAVPVIAIWAEKDAVIPISALGTLSQWNRTALQASIPEAGHDLLRTHAAEVSAAFTRLMTHAEDRD